MNRFDTKINDEKIATLEDLISSSQIQETPLVNKDDDDVDFHQDKDFLSFFDFDTNPFGDSLNTSFLYKSSQHDLAIRKMLMSIEHDISFGLVCGKSGTGKTLISQAILEKLDKKQFFPILVPVSPNLSKSAFLKLLLNEFGHEFEKNIKDINSLIQLLASYILSSFQSGIKPIIIIDECHFLSADTLHILRTLSNFESHNKKLITCLLFAEPPFYRRLNHPSYASLKSRIYLDIELSPLTLEETLNYINFRLRIAGVDENINTFTDDELYEIFNKSQGIPRNINKFATNMLLEKYMSLTL